MRLRFCSWLRLSSAKEPKEGRCAVYPKTRPLRGMSCNGSGSSTLRPTWPFRGPPLVLSEKHGSTAWTRTRPHANAGRDPSGRTISCSRRGSLERPRRRRRGQRERKASFALTRISPWVYPLSNQGNRVQKSGIQEPHLDTRIALLEVLIIFPLGPYADCCRLTHPTVWAVIFHRNTFSFLNILL